MWHGWYKVKATNTSQSAKKCEWCGLQVQKKHDVFSGTNIGIWVGALWGFLIILRAIIKKEPFNDWWSYQTYSSAKDWERMAWVFHAKFLPIVAYILIWNAKVHKEVQGIFNCKGMCKYAFIYLSGHWA